MLDLFFLSFNDPSDWSVVGCTQLRSRMSYANYTPSTYIVNLSSFVNDCQSFCCSSFADQPPDRLWSKPDVEEEEDARCWVEQGKILQGEDLNGFKMFGD